MISFICAVWLVAAPQSGAQTLKRPEGLIAYTDTGGPGRPVVCVPGIGEVKATWRFITPLLVQSGYRVIAMDVRGQGESSATFSSYTADAIGSDVVALLDVLDLHGAIVVGNSMGAAVAVWAAAERPDRVAALTLIGPFVRDFPIGTFTRMMLHGMLTRPWGPRAWGSYYRSLYKGNKPSDLNPYVTALVSNLSEPHRIEAVGAMMDSSKEPCEKRLIDVHVPTTVIMGTADSDFDDPAGEAKHVADALHGGVVMVDGSGHYPQVEQPPVVAKAIQGVAAP